MRISDWSSDVCSSDLAAEAIGKSKEWTTAGLLGQMAFDKSQAETLGKLFGLTDEAVAWLQIVPYKGSLPTAVPTDPLIYRWYEIVNVYGGRSEEHTSELQSLMRISYAVFCLKQKNNNSNKQRA